MAIYSGYIDCGKSEGDYEFESDEVLDAMGQLRHLLDTGLLQIIPSEPEESE